MAFKFRGIVHGSELLMPPRQTIPYDSSASWRVRRVVRVKRRSNPTREHDGSFPLSFAHETTTMPEPRRGANP
jgi:hypothetical protein